MAVSGSVTLDQQPVDNAIIVMVPQGTGEAVAAELVDGQFALDQSVGPTPGQYEVRINPRPAELGLAESGPAGAGGGPALEIPAVYQRPGKLSATIKDGENEPLVFQLSSREK
jgi:hypothetical protein